MRYDGTIKETGEIVKPYDTPEHGKILYAINRHVNFIKKNIKDESGTNLLKGKGGDELSDIMVILVGYYEEIGNWLADEKLHIDDLKTALDLKFADEYLAYKAEEGETNETARMKAKKACADDQRDLDINKHAWGKIEAHKKSMGRYHDSVRSLLGYEKTLAYMSR
jgi:hypothetical protein